MKSIRTRVVCYRVVDVLQIPETPELTVTGDFKNAAKNVQKLFSDKRLSCYVLARTQKVNQNSI